MVEFEFNCPECGQVIVVNEDLCGQFAECPYCKKNVVIPPSTESASVVEENDNVIPTGDFSEALAVCRQDFDFNDTFTKASRIAQLFLGIKAYCIHFHKNFEDSEVADCLADIEKDLTLNDIDYLLSKEYDSLIRERLLGIRRIYTSVRTKDGMSLQHEKDSITNANSKQGFFSKVFLQPVKLFLGLKRGWLVSCSSCGWQGFVIASREEVIRCNNCGEFLPLKDATDAYEKVSGDERSLSQEYTRREKIRKDFFTRAEEFEFDWKIFSDPASQRKIERIKAYTERLYRKASSLNANRIIRATHSVAASNRTFGNTMEGGYGTFVSLIGSFELAADESAERKLASETTDIEEVIERNEAFVDHYYDIVDEFADVEKAAARARRLKRLCGYADESELPELDLLIDYDLLERCAVLEKKQNTIDAAFFFLRLIAFFCVISLLIFLPCLLLENTRTDHAAREDKTFESVKAVQKEREQQGQKVTLEEDERAKREEERAKRAALAEYNATVREINKKKNSINFILNGHKWKGFGEREIATYLEVEKVPHEDATLPHRIYQLDSTLSDIRAALKHSHDELKEKEDLLSGLHLLHESFEKDKEQRELQEFVAEQIKEAGFDFDIGKRLFIHAFWVKSICPIVYDDVLIDLEKAYEQENWLRFLDIADEKWTCPTNGAHRFFKVSVEMK